MAEPQDRDKYIEQLQRTADGIMPLDGSDDYSGLAKLKQEL